MQKFNTRRREMQRGGFVNRAKCPKCGGNVYLDNDYFGWYEECLQCGYTRNLQKVVRVDAEGGDKYIETPIEIPVPKR
jgi:predicted nucleic-acid-binding Zn-ribbon protein